AVWHVPAAKGETRSESKTPTLSRSRPRFVSGSTARRSFFALRGFDFGPFRAWKGPRLLFAAQNILQVILGLLNTELQREREREREWFLRVLLLSPQGGKNAVTQTSCFVSGPYPK